MVEGNGAAITLYQMAPGHRFDLHHHPFAELGVILAGAGELLVENERRRLQIGDSFYVPGGARHGFVVAAGDTAVLLNVTVPPYSELDRDDSSDVLRLAARAVRKGQRAAERRPRGLLRVGPGAP